MLRDVFYYGNKPNVHPREKFATSIEDARQQCTTEHFWIINEFCEYRNFEWDFDFEFLPDEDVWAEEHNNVWPSQHQKDSGTWLCSAQPSEIIIYRADVDPVKRKNIKNDNWVLLDTVDETKFDFSWHPDPTSPPFIYVWGNKWNPVELQPVLEYHTPYATDRKYMNQVVELLPSDCFKEILPIDKSKFDLSWRPDPREPPFVYVWGSNWNEAAVEPAIAYYCPGATDRKYMNTPIELLPNLNNWDIPSNIDPAGFDFSWRPNPTSPPYTYQFGTQHQKTGGPSYVVEDATEVKYVDTQKVKKLPSNEHWKEILPIADFDFSWHPDDTDPPLIYTWGSQWNEAAIEPALEYHVSGATDRKYMPDKVVILPNKTNWDIPSNIDTAGFDFSWRPNPTSPPYVYEFGTQWQKTGGPRYVVEDATEVKYVDTSTAIMLSNKENWKEILPIADFDYSWHPDDTEPPFVYVWGSQWNEAAIEPALEYHVSGATERKYMPDKVVILPIKTNWDIPVDVDITNFDFSWRPNPTSPPYVYEFGTQWQKTGGPKYVVENATEIKYVDLQKVKKLPSNEHWKEFNLIKEFDYSWHPDDTDPPFIYQFGTQHQKTGGPKYTVEGATEIKYVDTSILTATRLPSMDNWKIPNNIDVGEFDFSWHPNTIEEPYIYEFGTQHQKTGGPRYVVEGAIDVKYIDTQKVKMLPNKEHWKEILPVADFDYSWHPDDTEPPFVYVWGSQWNEAAVEPAIAYYVPGATERKYMLLKVKLLPNKTNWDIPVDVDTTDFDFSWRPNPTSPPYIYQFGTQWQKTGGPKYVVENDTEIKYVDTQIVKKLPNKQNWKELLPIAEFDFSWHPDDTDPPFIYEFGTQHQKTGGPKYIVKGATEAKYVDDIKATVLAAKYLSNWIIPTNIDASNFDFSWHPDTTEEPYIYQFGTQWQKTGGPKYVVENATEIKYVDTSKAIMLPNKEHWKEILPVADFDYSWHPDATAPLYVYVWGSKWNEAAVEPVIAYYVPGATERKYMSSEIKLLPNKTNWDIPTDIDETKFDFSWRPNPTSPPYIYQFGTQHQKTGGPRYVVENATEIKYVEDLKAVRLPNTANWKISQGTDVSNFDFSWHPDDTSPPFIYRFGTLLDRDDGPRYVVPGNTGESVYMERILLPESVEIAQSYSKYIVTSTLEDLIKEHPDEIFWALNPNIDYTNFNFDWKPSIEQSQYIQVFGSSENTKTQTFLVNSVMWLRGNTELNWVEEQVKNKIDMFFVDRSNNESPARFERLKIRFPNITKTRYLNSWVDTINRCINRATSNLCWILNSELDYDDFDFNYYPNPWQMQMVHVFGTQWSHWGTTFIINRESFAQDTKYIKIIEHLSNINFVKDKKAKATNILYDVVYIDYGNKDLSEEKNKGNLIIPYEQNYLTTFKNLLTKLPNKKEHYVWLVSTICDYSNFDFTYICDPFAREQLHVFPSNKQKFGDTFLVNVNKLRELIADMTTLEDYNKINYNQRQRVNRLSAPIIITEDDSHVSSIDTEFNFPYAVFTTIDNKDINVIDTEPMSLWSEESKNIMITSTGGTRIIVPKEAKEHVKRELYDYPYITTNSKLTKSTPMDIVFFSNGEHIADKNYEHLLKLTQGLPNKVIRIDGINGRVKSQHAAANSSNTSWYFLVNAKLKVNSKFDFNWQPDRLQIPKHYIFHATNPVNGLVYGHQAIVANNKKLTLANFGSGLDFTMDSEHEVLDINSGVGVYNSSKWDTWRTAFRECIKLKASETEENIIRLNTWVTVANGDFAEYSLQGAQQAVQYYEEVAGDIIKLRLSYDWDWLKERFNNTYG